MWKNYIYTALISSLFIVFTAACTPWHLSGGSSENSVRLICIPYVHNDPSGDVTEAITRAVNELPGYRVDNGGRYELSAKILDEKDTKLGFRYDPIELHKGKKDLILSETRARVLCEVSLIDRFTNQIVKGPAYILGSAEYDHQESTINNNINHFSLGQLSDIDTAIDVVYIPLYRDLASKVGYWLQSDLDFIPKQPENAQTTSP